ncbi:MAG: hypothetical protein ACFFD7_17310 [Candidatus Thorarchaeota archaeon]
MLKIDGMNGKSYQDVQDEIEFVTNKLQLWNNIFDIDTNLYIDGWAISLREKSLYPRSIVIFKSFETNLYVIKSFEVCLENFEAEKFRELYSIENITNQDDLLIELKEIIYGKDLGNQILKMCNDTFS